MVSLVIAAQDEALSTRYHLRNIMKQPTDSKCRMCYKAQEHVLLRDAQQLHHLSTLNMWGYRLLTNTMNIYLKGS